MEKQPNRSADALFTNAPPVKVFLSLSLPVILGMVVSLVYNMVDTYFVGQLGDANQMAAVSLCAPLFTLLMGLGNIFGIGGSSVVSRLMGQQKHDDVRHASATCFYCAVTLGAAVAAILLMLKTPLLRLLGTSDNTTEYTSQYFVWIVSGAPLMMIQFTFLNLLRCDGAARESMLGSIIGSVVNMALDPLLIFTFGMGVAGAAIATVIGNLCTCVFFLWYVLRRSRLLSVAPAHFRFDLRLLGGVFAIGLPASVTNALTSVATVLLNNMLLPFGDTAIAAMGIAAKVNMIVILLQIGFAAGLPPVLGYNWGARNMARLREILRAAFLFSLALGAVLTVLVFAFAPAAVRVFMDDPQITVPGTQMLRALMLCGPFLGVLFIITNFFQATGKALPAMLLSLCRQGIIFVAVLFPASRLLGWDGIVYAQPAADYITLLIALALFAVTALPALRRKQA